MALRIRNRSPSLDFLCPHHARPSGVWVEYGMHLGKIGEDKGKEESPFGAIVEFFDIGSDRYVGTLDAHGRGTMEYWQGKAVAGTLLTEEVKRSRGRWRGPAIPSAWNPTRKWRSKAEALREALNAGRWKVSDSNSYTSFTKPPTKPFPFKKPKLKLHCRK